MLTRRSFLATVAALAGTAACRNKSVGQTGATTGIAATRRRLERIGIQLYTVRQDMQRDLPGTLARLAEIGYREVEFAGYFGRAPAEIRQLLERHGLRAPSTHVGFDLVRGDWDRALDTALATGHQYVTVPWLPDDVRGTAASWRRVAQDFNRAGERARARGLRFAYHNHDFEFVRTEGIVPLDVLVAETDPAVVDFQMDIYWVTKAGGDPLAYIRQHPTRFTTVHVKDSAGPPGHAQVDVGAGKIDFASIFRLDAEQRNVIRHFFVEHDQPPDPMAFAKKSFDYLRALEF
jgi:sugar phosphate isomerase/epimerase